MAAPQQPLTFNDVFEEEDIDEPKAANSVHHIRANSSIMQLKKILGELLTSERAPLRLGRCWCLWLQSHTAKRSNCLSKRSLC